MLKNVGYVVCEDIWNKTQLHFYLFPTFLLDVEDDIESCDNGDAYDVVVAGGGE